MNHLDVLESDSIYIIREAYRAHQNLAMLWSIGKDSTTLLWLCRKAFLGRIPFKTLHIDTGYKFQEIYDFREKYAKEWGLNLVVARNEEAIRSGMGPDKGEKFQCCMSLKTQALQDAVRARKFDGLLLGIRRDEHGIRAKERVFSPRNQSFEWNYRDQPPEMWDYFRPPADGEYHTRVHPLLAWTELDIWLYAQREGLPIVDLYFAKDGRRFRSIGCETCCQPVQSSAATVDDIVEELRTTKISERSGRAQDKESAYTMQKLRALGYM